MKITTFRFYLNTLPAFLETGFDFVYYAKKDLFQTMMLRS